MQDQNMTKAVTEKKKRNALREETKSNSQKAATLLLNPPDPVIVPHENGNHIDNHGSNLVFNTNKIRKWNQLDTFITLPEWWQIKGYKNNYLISNFGEIENTKSGRMLKPKKDLRKNL